MNTLILIFLLILNFGISSWNAYSAGSYLTESKLIGGWPRFLTWCGLIMSACGFTWVYLTIIGTICVATGWLSPYWGEILFKLGYLIIILPILGSGFGIWIHSLTNAFRQRTFGNIAAAGWNTYAQASNTWNAARHAPGFLKDVMGAFTSKSGGKDDSNAKAVLLILILAILAVAGGFITTFSIARWADRKVALDMSPSDV